MKSEYASLKEFNKALNDLLISLYRQGRLAAAVDSIQADSISRRVFIHRGPEYKWVGLHRGNLDDAILNDVKFREKIFRERPLDPGEFAGIMESILVHCENNGYPFARVGLDSISVESNSIEATINLQKEKLIVIDSVRILGDARIAPVYIYNYTGIKPGDIYNESQIDKISSRIKELPFLVEKEPVKVIFTQKHTKLYLNLEKRKSSNFNGILGVLPNEQTGKILITGDARIKLLNSFHHGETVAFNWRKLQTNTQDINANVVYPFVFSTPFGVDVSLKLYRKDTIYSSVNRTFGIQYLLKGGNYFEAFVSKDNSDLISTAGLLGITALPEYADVSTLSYGLALRTERLDYRLNPRKGIDVEVKGSLGNKTIRQNANINPEVYDSLNLKSIHAKVLLRLDLFIPLLKRTAFKIGLNNAYLTDETLFENELYRIGGLKSLRGFDEESVNASIYSIVTAEFRYLLERNSYAYLFWDGAYYENTSVGNRVFDRPFGFGAGISFETSSGIFSINYALGKQFDNPLLLKTAKVHFGFVNFF